MKLSDISYSLIQGKKGDQNVLEASPERQGTPVIPKKVEAVHPEPPLLGSDPGS